LVLRDRLGEGLVDALDAIADDVREADEERQLEPARCELLREIVQIDALRPIRIRRDLDVTAAVDVEVRRAPALDLVALRGAFRVPVRAAVRFLGGGVAPRDVESRVE